MSAAVLLQLMKRDGTDPDPGTHRKRPRSSTNESKPPRLIWSPDDVRAMLDLRFSAQSLKRFETCKTAKQKSAWWAWLTKAVSVKLGRPVVIKQVKNRYDKLKVEYQQVLYAENHRRAHPNTYVRYPEYWPALVDYFQLGKTSNAVVDLSEESAGAEPNSTGSETSSDDDSFAGPVPPNEGSLHTLAQLGEAVTTANGRCQAALSNACCEQATLTNACCDPTLSDMVWNLKNMLQAQAARLESFMVQQQEVARQQNAINIQIFRILGKMADDGASTGP